MLSGRFVILTNKRCHSDPAGKHAPADETSRETSQLDAGFGRFQLDRRSRGTTLSFSCSRRCCVDLRYQILSAYKNSDFTGSGRNSVKYCLLVCFGDIDEDA